MSDPVEQECRALVFGFFDGDAKKTELWFHIPNPLLGNIEPVSMFKIGRGRKLLAFIKHALASNKPGGGDRDQ